MDRLMLEDLKIRSQNGDDAAMICLSRQMQDIATNEEDVKQANVWRRKAEEKGNKIAVAMKYYHGWDGEANLPQSSKMLVEYLKDPSNHQREDIYVAYHMMSYLYGEGIGVEKDLDKSFELCSKAADLMCVAAMNNLAISYQYGDGCQENIVKAIGLYERAHSLGHSAASYNLALMYYYGRGIKSDKDKSIQYYEISANRGFAKAFSSLIEIYRTERINEAKVKEFLMKGALLNIPEITKQFIEYITKTKMDWETKLHKFWVLAHKRKSNECDLNQVITNMLLISKYRSFSQHQLLKSVMVKGIVMQITKYFCELNL